MEAKDTSRRTGKRSLLVIGAFVVFAAIFSLFEALMPREQAAPSSAGETGTVPIPEVRRRDDGAVEIRHGFVRRTSIRLGDDEAERQLYDCLVEGIEAAFPDGTATDVQRVRDELARIQQECMGGNAVPSVPPPPPPRPTARSD